MKTLLFSMFFLWVAGWAFPAQVPPKAYPIPPDLRIIDFGMRPGLEPKTGNVDGSLSPVAPSRGSTSAGNVPIRAEYGVEPEQRPLNGDSFRRDRDELARGGGSRYSLPHPPVSSAPKQHFGQGLMLFVENTGTRQIKSVEWEYAYCKLPQGSHPDVQSLQSNAIWTKVRNKVTIPPGTKARLHAAPRQGRRGEGQNATVYFRWGVRITRVEYVKSSDWRAP